MKKLTFLKIFLCFAFAGLMASSVEAGYPYSMTYTVSAGDTILADHYNTGNNEHINNNIPESIDDYSATVNEMGATKDPYAGDTEVQAVTLAEELQELRHAIDQLKKKFNTSATKWYHDTTDEGVLWVTGIDVTSGTETTFAIDGRRLDVTGVTAITSFVSVGVGTVKTVEFTGALILTHHATNLRLPNGANITTIAGDLGTFHEYASGDWELIGWSGHILGLLDDDSMATATDTTVASSESIKAYIATQVSASVPPGVISPYGGATAPSGWLLCDGTTGLDSVADTTLAPLFAIIGTTFGGASSSDFDLPDLRGRFPLGKDNMGGSSANRVTDTEADSIGGVNGDEAALIAHNHSHTHGQRILSTGTAGTAGTQGADSADANTAGTTVSDATSAGSGSSSMNPYLTFNYIIKK